MKPVATAISFLTILTWVGSQTSDEFFDSDKSNWNDSNKTRAELGVVFGARNCENWNGPGKFVEWLVEGCNTTDTPCRTTTNGKRLKYEFTYIPSEYSELLLIDYFIFREEDSTKSYGSQRIFHKTVTPGTPLTIQYEYEHRYFELLSEPTNFTIVQSVHNRWNGKNVHEICTEADFIIG